MTSTPPSSPVASAPFNNPYGDADVVFRSVDGIDFYAHKAVLRIASGFFADMFSLPQPGSTPAQDISTPIEVSESGQILDCILRLCYPVEEQHSILGADLPRLKLALAAAMKYQLEKAISIMRSTLRINTYSDPLQVFVIACGLKLEEEARDAALAFCDALHVLPGIKTARELRFKFDRYIPEMNDISAGSYYRLLQYRATSSPLRMELTSMFKFCHPSPPELAHPFRGVPAHPFHDFSKADIIIRSSDKVEFYVHKQFLSFASPKLDEMLRQSCSGDDAIKLHDLHVLDLPEDGYTLAILIRLCYPMVDPVGLDDWDVYDLLEAAQKYDIDRAMQFVKKMCLEFIRWGPAKRTAATFFMAMRCNWIDEAKEAAIHMVYQNFDPYVFPMTTASAAVYRRLLVYRQTCRETICRLRNVALPQLSEKQRQILYWNGDVNESWQSPAENRFWLEVHERVHSIAVSPNTQPASASDQESIIPAFLGLKFPIAPNKDPLAWDQFIKQNRESVLQVANALQKVEL